MTNSKNHRLQGLSLTPFFLGLMAMLFIVNTAQGQDWDGDGINDTQDWGVALTFDMHPRNYALNPTGHEDSWYWTDWWTTSNPNVLDILADQGATATFFAGFFNSAGPGTAWQWLLNDVVTRSQGHELAWHGRKHEDAGNWMTSWMSLGLPWITEKISAEAYVTSELSCEVTNYTTANLGWWPQNLLSYAYPNTSAHDAVDTELKKYVGHARGSGGPLDTFDPSGLMTDFLHSYSTSNIASFFRLQGYWLDEWHIQGNSDEAKKLITRAYDNNRIAILAAHSFDLGSLLNPTVLRDILDHINCLRDGGTVPSGAVECTGDNPGSSTNTVYHRFRDLPTNPSDPALVPVPLPTMSNNWLCQ